MKNSIKAMAGIALTSIFITGNAYTQEVYVNTSGKTAYTYASGSNAGTGAENSISSESLATTNPSLVAKFSSLFPSAKNAKWSGVSDNFWVSFMNDGHKSSASFTPKGKMNYLITGCNLEQLPGSFRKTIQKEYPGYKLFDAIEIKAYGEVAYQAVVENENNYITLKYTSEGVEEIQQLKKLLVP